MQNLCYVPALLALFTISGCGSYFTAPNIEESDIAAYPSTSFIVGSVTQSSDGYPTRFDDRTAFYFRKKDGSRRFRVESAEIMRPIMGPPSKALADRGLEEQHGKLFTVQLQPGIYQLVRFAIEWPSQQNIIFPDPIEFKLLPGEVAYLGNLDARFCVRHAYANQSGVSGVIVSVTDHMSRDAPLLRDRFIALRQAHITKKVISNTELWEQAGSLRKGCE